MNHGTDDIGRTAQRKAAQEDVLRIVSVFVLGLLSLIAALVFSESDPLLSIGFALFTVEAIVASRVLWFAATRPAYIRSRAASRDRRIVYGIGVVTVIALVMSFL